MVEYVLRRLLYSVPVLIGITVVAFMLIHLVPGDPAREMLGYNATPQSVAILRHELGLDRSLPSAFGSFIAEAVHGNFGESYFLQAPVLTVIRRAVVPSLWLILYAVVISMLLAVPLAVVAALRHNAAADHGVRLLTMVVFAMPSFWVGLLLAFGFSLKLGWFPVAGYESGFTGVLRTLTLPAVALAFYLSPMLTRTLRASLIEVLGGEFIEAARARGFSEMRVVGFHALRNASLATITVLSVNVGYLIGGTVVVEKVFGVPGLGSLLVESIVDRDYPLIRAMTLFFGIAVVVINLLTDVAYATVDPRVRLTSR